MHGKILMSKQTQLFPVGLFIAFLTIILGIIANCFIKQNKILLAKIIIVSIFGTMASFAIHIFSLSSFGSGRLHISIGMTIGYIFVMLYVLSDVLEHKTFSSYLLNSLLYLWFLTNIFNFMFLTYEHQLANKIDKQKTMEIVKYVQEYEKENNIEVKYVAMKYFPNTNKGHYKQRDSVNCLAIYSECSYDGLINLYLQRKLRRVNLTLKMNEEYNIVTNGNEEFVCIGNVLICPIYNF